MIDGLGRGFVHGTTTVGAHGGLEGRSELRRTERTCGFSSGLREGSAPPSQGEIKSGEYGRGRAAPERGPNRRHRQN